MPLLDVLDPERRLLGADSARAALAAARRRALVRRAARRLPGSRRRSTSRTRLASRVARRARAETGIPPERTVLGGFSQGAVMSLRARARRGRPRPAGDRRAGGFVPAVEGWELDLERELPPVAIGHGTYDPIIAVEFGRQARGSCSRRAGADVTYRESPLPHAIDPRFAAELAAVGRAGVCRAGAGPRADDQRDRGDDDAARDERPRRHRLAEHGPAERARRRPGSRTRRSRRARCARCRSSQA